MAEIHVERCRPEWVTTTTDDSDPPVTTTTYLPDAETYQGAVMYAARELRRRNSPAGVETFGDVGVSFVAKYDPDIDRASADWCLPTPRGRVTVWLTSRRSSRVWSRI